MNDKDAILETIKSPKVLGIVGASVLALIIWFAAVYSPLSSKATSLKLKAQTLQTQVVKAKAQLKMLQNEATNVTPLKTKLAILNLNSPTTLAHLESQFIKSVKATTIQSLVQFVQITPQAPKYPKDSTSSSQSATQSVDSPFTTITLTLKIYATYTTLRTFITNLYNLPELTLIDKLKIVAGARTTSPTTKCVTTRTGQAAGSSSSSSSTTHSGLATLNPKIQATFTSHWVTTHLSKTYNPTVCTRHTSTVIHRTGPGRDEKLTVVLTLEIFATIPNAKATAKS